MKRSIASLFLLVLTIPFMRTDALGACTAPTTGAVRFISPANGTMDVARWPVMSISFLDSVTVQCDPFLLSQGIRLYDRVGTQVPLQLRCSPYDPKVVIAAPQLATFSSQPDYRLDPASE